MRKDFGALVPLIRLLRPVVTWFCVSRSPYLKENRRVEFVVRILWTLGRQGAKDAEWRSEVFHLATLAFLAANVLQRGS
jgi:hypothetical protein